MIQTKVNINIAVDVVKALSDQSLQSNIYVMDDSVLESRNQGTGELCTRCQPGQTLLWRIYALDLQTPVAIKNIEFIPETQTYDEKAIAYVKDSVEADATAVVLSDGNPDNRTWCGILPWIRQGHPYRYRLTLEAGKGVYSVLSIDTLSLEWNDFTLYDVEQLKKEEKL